MMASFAMLAVMVSEKGAQSIPTWVIVVGAVLCAIGGMRGMIAAADGEARILRGRNRNVLRQIGDFEKAANAVGGCLALLVALVLLLVAILR